jgi:hypothetical protein
MRPIRLAAALWMAATVSAQDKRLRDLHATLSALHSHSVQATRETLGARPELTVAKHQLRDWIETQLGSLKDEDGEKAFAVQINQALKPVSVKDPDEQNLLGSLGEVRIKSESGMLIVTTPVGIICQYDESAYVYKRASDHWQRIWESERNDYSSKRYTPQHIMAVHVWHSFGDGQDGPVFILTLGNASGCESSWHSVYYRVWRVESSGSKLLIDGSEWAWMRADNYAEGSIGRDMRNANSPLDVLIEFAESSIDGAVHSREAIRHFFIEGDRARRVDPVALSPRDFVDEWMTRPWNESAAWSESPTLRQWHRELHADFVAGRFIDASMRCQTPDLWQVTVEPDNAAKNFQPGAKLYFLVRWLPPYHFTMMSISDKPWPRCVQADREADQWRTLFSNQEWRW